MLKLTVFLCLLTISTAFILDLLSWVELLRNCRNRSADKCVCWCILFLLSSNPIMVFLHPCQNINGQQLHSSLHLGHFGHGWLSVPSSAWRRTYHGGLVMHFLKQLDLISEKRKHCFLQSKWHTWDFAQNVFCRKAMLLSNGITSLVAKMGEFYHSCNTLTPVFLWY